MKSAASKHREPPETVKENPERPNLDEELSWWGNASMWWGFKGASGAASPLDWLNGDRTPDLWTTWRKDILGMSDPDSHPVGWLPFWKREFMLGDERESRPGAYDAIESLHRLGMSLLPLLSEIKRTRLVLGPSKRLQHSMASRRERWDDVEKLRNGAGDEQWKIIEKWAPILRNHTPSVMITILQDPVRDETVCVMQKWDPVAQSYSPKPAIPAGFREKTVIKTTAYPDKKVLGEMGESVPQREVVKWIARQILRLGPAKRQKLAEIEIYSCALKLEGMITNQLGTPRYRHIGQLLAAAFPDHFKPTRDIANATMKLLGRARETLESDEQRRRRKKLYSRGRSSS